MSNAVTVTSNEELSDDVTKSKSPLLVERHVYKPFLYPWCYEAWLTQQRDSLAAGRGSFG